MRSHTTLLALGLAASVASAGAASAQTPTTPAQRLTPSVTTDSGVPAVTVDNPRGQPAAVYLERGRFARRLGVVPALGTATLALPQWAVDRGLTMRLVVRPEGARASFVVDSLPLVGPARYAVAIPATEPAPAPLVRQMVQVIPADAVDGATVTVENPRDRPVSVIAERGAFATKLGEVAAGARATLRLPSTLADGNAVKLVIESRGATTQTALVRLRLGEHAGLTTTDW